MPNKFFPAPEVEEIGRELIRAHHVHLLEHNARVEPVDRHNGRAVKRLQHAYTSKSMRE